MTNPFAQFSSRGQGDNPFARFKPTVPDEKRQRILDIGEEMKRIPNERVSGAFEDAAPVEDRRLPISGGRSVAEGFGDAAALGFADELGAFLELPVSALFGGNLGEKYQHNLNRRRAVFKQAQEQHPVETIAGQVAGAVATPLPAMGAARTAHLGSRVGRSMLTGAGAGAAYGAGRADGGAEDRLEGALTGGLVGAGVGAAAPAVGQLVGRAVGVRRPQAGPATEELRRASQGLYQAADQAGIQLSGPAFQRLAHNVAVRARRAGIDPGVHPKANSALTRLLGDATGQNRNAVPTLGHVDTLRQILRDAGSSSDAAERRIAQIMVEGFDEQLGRLQPRDITGSRDPTFAFNTLRSARELWKRFRKAEIIDNILNEKALNAEGANYSQANAQTAVRQQFRGILNDPKKARQFTDVERELMRRVVRGGITENILRLAGKFSPRGAVSAIPSIMLGGIPGVIIAVAGEGARAASRSMARRSTERLSEAVRSGGRAIRRPAATAGELRVQRGEKALAKAGAQQVTERQPLRIELNMDEWKRIRGER